MVNSVVSLVAMHLVMLQHCTGSVLSQPSTREGKHSNVFLVGTHSSSESKHWLASSFPVTISEDIIPVNKRTQINRRPQGFSLCKEVEDMFTSSL